MQLVRLLPSLHLQRDEALHIGVQPPVDTLQPTDMHTGVGQSHGSHFGCHDAVDLQAILNSADALVRQKFMLSALCEQGSRNNLERAARARPVICIHA